MKFRINNNEFSIMYLESYMYTLWKTQDPNFNPEQVLKYETWRFRHWTFCFPFNEKLRTIEDNYVVEIPLDATLLFDKSSDYPRYKLSLTQHKRCVKTTKADYIVVNENPIYSIEEVCIYTYNDDKVILVDNNTFKQLGKNAATIKNYIEDALKIKVECLYRGPIHLVDRTSEFLYRYVSGDYTQKFISDNNLDNLINSTLVEPQFEELFSIAQLLDSADPETRKMGAKMLLVYNSNKYKLSISLALAYSNKDISREVTDVATKQLINTIGISPYVFNPRLPLKNKLYYCYHPDTEYTVEDIAIAKEFVKVMLKNEIQSEIKILRARYSEIIPDVEIICS